MLQEIVQEYIKDVLSQSNLNDVFTYINNKFIGYAGVFKGEAITVSSNSHVETANLAYQLPDGTTCQFQGFRSIEVLNDVGKLSELKSCISALHSAKPIEACSDQLFFSRRPETVAHPRLTRARHAGWHVNDGNAAHTHIYKVTPDGKRLAGLTKEEVTCVLSQYRKAAEGLIGSDMYADNGKKLEEKFTADMLMTEEQIQEFANFYETANHRLEELAKDIYKNCKQAFFEAFMLTLATQIMERYLFPLLKYHSSDVNKTVIGCVEKAIPFFMLAYRLYLSAMSPMSPVYYAGIRFLGQLATTGFHVGGHRFFTLLPPLMMITKAIHMKGDEEAFKQLGKLVGFELGYVTALSGSQFATVLATALIRRLHKLKPEEPSVEVESTVAHRPNEHETLRRRFK